MSVSIILALFPLFSEFDVFGIKVKKEIDKITSEVEKTRNDLQKQFLDFRASLNNSVVINNYSQQPALQEKLETLQKSASIRLPKVDEPEKEIDVPANASYLFRIRYAVEKELRRIYYNIVVNKVDNKDYRSFVNTREIVNVLLRGEYLYGSDAETIVELLKICNLGVHGNDFSDKQLQFVREVSPGIIRMLKQIVE